MNLREFFKEIKLVENGFFQLKKIILTDFRVYIFIQFEEKIKYNLDFVNRKIKMLYC